MTEDAQPPGTSPLALTLSVSGHRAFVPALEALATRIGQYAGCAADDARDLGRAIARALTRTAQQSGVGGGAPRIDLVVQATDRVLKVDLTFVDALPAGITLEDVFGGHEVVNEVRQLVDRLEFGDAGSGSCRLTCQIRDGH